jgi:hypothetical protein
MSQWLHLHFMKRPISMCRSMQLKSSCSSNRGGGGEDEFKGCHMLAEVENTESSGVGSWTRLQWR